MGVIAALLAGIAGGLLGGLIAFWGTRLRHPAIARQVLVNFAAPEAPSLRGVLVKRQGQWLVLANVELLHEDGPVRMDGEVVVDDRRVAFLQVFA